jgi:hypothetical protein
MPVMQTVYMQSCSGGHVPHMARAGVKPATRSQTPAWKLGMLKRMPVGWAGHRVARA